MSTTATTVSDPPGLKQLQQLSEIVPVNTSKPKPKPMTEPSKNSTEENVSKETKTLKRLRPDAPEFDVKSSPTIDPYGHPLGIATRPEYVPPASMEPLYPTQYPNTTSSGGQSAMPAATNARPPHLPGVSPHMAAPVGYPPQSHIGGGSGAMQSGGPTPTNQGGPPGTGSAGHNGMLMPPTNSEGSSNSGIAHASKSANTLPRYMGAPPPPHMVGTHNHSGHSLQPSPANGKLPSGTSAKSTHPQLIGGRPPYIYNNPAMYPRGVGDAERGWIPDGSGQSGSGAGVPPLPATGSTDLHHPTRGTGRGAAYDYYTQMAAHKSQKAAAVAAAAAMNATINATINNHVVNPVTLHGYKQPPRKYGQPKTEETDPTFTNPPEIRDHQRWELLESAKRWLPGEGTVITWNNCRYVIGAPIHMGMNGHIHYCYRYPVPISERKSTPSNKQGEKDSTSSDTTAPHTHEDDTASAAEKNSVNKSIIDLSNAIPPPDTTSTHNSPGGGPDEMPSRKDVTTVAAKVVPNTSAFAREIVILRALQGCENITKLYEVIESRRTLISILELAQADVYNFFVGRGAARHGWSLDKPAVREAFARMVVTNAVQGLKQMHDNNYLHCDLKSLNILLYIYKTDRAVKKGGVYMKAKLTDFGHSSHGTIRRAEAPFRNGMARVGTAGHVAPELFCGGKACDYKIDIWSLGIVMFSMLVPGRLLFSEYTNLGSLRKAYEKLNTMNPWSQDARPKWWTDFERLSPEARDLILWMTRFDPEERPTGEQILQHPWFIISKGNLKPGQYRPKLQYVDMLCSSSIAQE